MADVEVHAASPAHGRVQTLTVRMKNTAPRTIDRETALRLLQDGHSLIVYAGHGSHAARGRSIVRVEVGEDFFLRTDTSPEAEDHIDFPAESHH
jgi:hypothetical protein